MHTGSAQPSRQRRIVIGIPARYHSTRFPGKALAGLAGRPLIEHVYRRAAQVPAAERVVVATDDARIVRVVEGFGGEARLTRADHHSGTDRLAEAFAQDACDLVVNLQGDEPLIDPRAISQALEPFILDAELEVSTLKTRLREWAAVASPHVVKVVTDAAGYALSFSRSPDPPLPATGQVDLEKVAYFKHIGLYVFTHAFLQRFVQLPPTPGEERERLEQLRMLDHGVRVKVVETPYDSLGVDTPEDLARAESLLSLR